MVCRFAIFEFDDKEIMSNRPFEVQENLTLETNLGIIIKDIGVIRIPERNNRNQRTCLYI